MNGFERRAQQIKDKIKQATQRMLSAGSVKQIRIADIAREAGVSQVTIYNYFGSKEALIREVFKDYVLATMEDFEDFIRGEHSLKEKVEHIIFQKKQTTHSFHPSVIAELMQEDPEIRGFVQKNYEEHSVPMVVEFITKCKENGEISDSISIETVILYLNMLNDSSHRLLESTRYSQNQEKLIEEMVQVFFYGICGPQTQK